MALTNARRRNYIELLSRRATISKVIRIVPYSTTGITIVETRTFARRVQKGDKTETRAICRFWSSHVCQRVSRKGTNEDIHRERQDVLSLGACKKLFDFKIYFLFFFFFIKYDHHGGYQWPTLDGKSMKRPNEYIANCIDLLHL